MHLYFVRHGESEANAQNINQGHLNSPLTQKGIHQAKVLAKLLEKIDFELIYSSDLDRAKDTAEIIKMNRPISVQTSSLLREKSFGVLEGINKLEYEKAIQLNLDIFNTLTSEQKWSYRIHSEIETDIEVFERFNLCIKNIINQNFKNILIVSHRGPIRLFLAKHGLASYENIETNNALPNTGYIKINYNDEKFSIAVD